MTIGLIWAAPKGALYTRSKRIAKTAALAVALVCGCPAMAASGQEMPPPPGLESSVRPVEGATRTFSVRVAPGAMPELLKSLRQFASENGFRHNGRAVQDARKGTRNVITLMRADLRIAIANPERERMRSANAREAPSEREYNPTSVRVAFIPSPGRQAASEKTVYEVIAVFAAAVNKSPGSSVEISE